MFSKQTTGEAAMALANAAFETPAARAMPSAKRSPLDLAVLSTAVPAGAGTEVDTLKAFSRQARQCLHVMVSGDAKQILATADLLGKSAQQVGATRIAEATALLAREGVAASSVAVLGAAIVETENFILKLCR